MKIKKLELVGFKSFLEKTSFSFDVPVTSVVGPNGCGKSNIVDALKWVTGELSFKELRGKSMEDLIFAGSELRPPTSMMEVNLTLDNAEGLAPVQFKDFTDISITRRMFRDGSSEFYINKTACRLRDITDLFLDTGIGESSYSIIEQGKVGAIVSSRAEDRRLMIEEAAGVTKFKSRKKAALRKIEMTKQNLLRVSDILKELKRQIGTLERQAKKAEKFREVRDRARDIDLSLMSKDYSFIAAELDRLIELEKTLLDRQMEEETKLTTLESEYETLRLALIESEQQFEEAQQQLFRIKEKITFIENQIEMDQREASQLKTLAAEEVERANALLLKKEKMLEEHTRITQELGQLENRKSEIVLKLQNVVNEEEKSQSEFNAMNVVLEAEKQKLLSFVSNESDLKGRLDLESQKLNQVNHRMELLSDRLNEVRDEIQTVEEKYKHKQDEFESASQLKFTFEKDQQTQAEKLGALKAVYEQTQKKLSTLSQRLEGERGRLKALKEFETTYQGYQAGVQKIMAQKEDFTFVEGLLGEMVGVKKGYEKAAQAALQDWLECMVVDSPQSAKKAIAYLNTHQGKGSFIPTSTSFAQHARRNEPLPGTGQLLDVLTFKNDIGAVFFELFQDIFVVDNLDQALDLWSQGHRYTFVTLTGERVSRLGVITGGTLEGERGVLEIRNEIEDLNEKIEAGESEARTLAQFLAEKDLESNQLEKLLAGIEQSLREQSKKSVDTEREYHRLEESLIHIREKFETLEKEEKELLTEKNLLLSNIDQKQNALTELLQFKQETEQAMEGFVREADKLKIVWLGVSQRSTEIQVEKASLVERIESYLREKESLEQQSEQAINDHHDLMSRSKLKLQDASAIEEKLEVKRQEKNNVIESHQAQEEHNKNLRSIHDQKAQELRICEETVKTTRTQKEKTLEDLTQLKMNLQEQEHGVQRLKEQAYERYEKDLIQVIQETSLMVIEDSEIEARREELSELRESLRKIGDVHVGAIEELKELQERSVFVEQQHNDLEKSLEDLIEAIKTIDATTKEKFETTLHEVNARFQVLFPKLFKGGKAKLELTNPENILESGIDILAQPPGKRLQSMNLMSGGEKALTAIALLFSIFEYKAPPFCVLDEVDAPLDDMNVGRFSAMVKQMSEKTQFIVVTHNKMTMEIADNLYGVTMEEPGVSRVVSVRVHQAMEQVQPVSQQHVA